jgi:tRNA-dihydrouridine synthase A
MHPSELEHTRRQRLVPYPESEFFVLSPVGSSNRIRDPGKGSNWRRRDGSTICSAMSQPGPISPALSPWAFSVAPMMDWTDRHDRYLLRLISPRTRLYTEMVTTGALIHGPREDLLRFDPAEHPVALQIGGSEPDDLARAAAMGEQAGYDEINLNCGCPSDRVQSGRFGACLMREPELVARGVAAMKRAVAVPVTVKCRIGVDDQDPETVLPDFIARVRDAGADAVIVHARKAWLQGLSPKENRDVPPLDYGLVRRMGERFHGLPVVLNGGLTTIEACLEEGRRLAGVMVGREAYHRPMLLAEAERGIFGAEPPLADGRAAVLAMIPYVEREMAAGAPLSRIARHMLGLANGRPGARRFRRMLGEEARRPGANARLLEAAADVVDWTPAARAA